MKKLLLSAAVALMGLTATAQDLPDAGTWFVGQDVTEALGLGNPSFTESDMAPWKYEGTGSTTKTGGLFEVYDGENCDLYQYIQVPAGMYEVNCQAYYRYGTSWDVDPNSWQNGSWKNEASVYVATGTYDIDSEAFTASGDEFTNPVMPRLFEGVMEQLYVDEVKEGWDMSDGQYNQCGGIWGPCSVPGSLIWFEQNKYLPFESDADETVYNKVVFYVTEPAWIKLGVKKTTKVSADSFMATNFHIIYKGDAGEAAKLELAKKTLLTLDNKLNNLQSTIADEFPGLGDYMLNAIMDADFDESTVEGVEKGCEIYRAMYDEYEGYYKDAQALAKNVLAMKEKAENTDYPGKPAFQEAIDAADAVLTAEDASQLGEPANIVAANAALTEACAEYVKSQKSEGGVVNYSDMIAYPFFCLPAYNPTWDEDANLYRFSEDIEATWVTVQEQSYPEALSANSSWTPICDGVIGAIATSGNDEGRWVINQTTWHNGNLQITMQHGYPALGGWTAEPSGNPEFIHQTITGIPNGYYSMSALMCNVQTISDLQYVYIKNSEGAEERAQLTQSAQGWWGGWSRPSIWQKLTTKFIQVTDGKVTIGSSSDSFYAVTGFQLYYHGETPDFNAMIAPELALADSMLAEKLTFPGDIAYVSGLLATIELPISSFDAYNEATATLKEANDYINTAYSYLNTWSLIDDVLNEQTKYDVESDEYKILENFYINTVEVIGTRDDDTYQTAKEASDLYASYKAYMNYRATVEAVAEYNSEIPTIIAAENAKILEVGMDLATLQSFQPELEAAYNVAMTNKNSDVFTQLGCDKASESNPVDITSVIKNPKYDNGREGWEGSNFTVDGNLHNAEIYNTASFDFHQSLAGIPAGCYVIKVQAYYRDGGSAGDVNGGVYYNWNIYANEEMELWENKNVELYANTGAAERVSYVQSLATPKYTEPSTDKIINKIDMSNAEDLLDENGNQILDENGQPIVDPASIDTIYYTYDDAEITWQLDQRVTVETEEGEVVYYYPNSMTGANARFTKTPDSYINEVAIMVEAGETLTFGLRKNKEIGNDWVIFDNWKVYYLGKDAPTAIENIEKPVAVQGIFNLAGQKIAAPVKGINIVNGKKYIVK